MSPVVDRWHRLSFQGRGMAPPDGVEAAIAAMLLTSDSSRESGSLQLQLCRCASAVTGVASVRLARLNHSREEDS